MVVAVVLVALSEVLSAGFAAGWALARDLLATAFFTDLPIHLGGKRIRGTLGAGVTYVAPRPLPNGASSDSIFTIDAAGSLTWTHYELSLAATNLLDTKYRLGEFNDVSDYHGQPQPTTAPARAFIAGPPLGVFASLAVNFGGS